MPSLQERLYACAQNHTYVFGAERCSKSSEPSQLAPSTYDECERLESCSRDPIGFYGGYWNIYSYVRGTPTVTNDPFGWLYVVVQTQLIPDIDSWPRTPGHVLPHFPEARSWPDRESDPPYSGTNPLLQCLNEKHQHQKRCDARQGVCWRICKTWWCQSLCMPKCDLLDTCCTLGVEINYLTCKRNKGLMPQPVYLLAVTSLINQGKSFGCSSISVSGGGGSIGPYPFPTKPPQPLVPIPVPPGYILPQPPSTTPGSGW